MYSNRRRMIAGTARSLGRRYLTIRRCSFRHRHTRCTTGTKSGHRLTSPEGRTLAGLSWDSMRTRGQITASGKQSSGKRERKNLRKKARRGIIGKHSLDCLSYTSFTQLAGHRRGFLCLPCPPVIPCRGLLYATCRNREYAV